MSWNTIHNHYLKQDWSQIPSFFAREVSKFFPKGGKILEIGAGLGQDSRFFHSLGFTVVSTDFSLRAVELNIEKSVYEYKSGGYRCELLDVTQKVPYLDGEFDIVYLHLSFHYFSVEIMKEIVSELHRIMKDGGMIALLLNTVDDPEYASGTEIEKDFFMINGISKRFFTIESAQEILSSHFRPILSDNEGETYKDSEKGIHKLIRYIGIKN